ncbi:MAG: MFS transporter [Acidobacteriaceae bacterium]|nr:MFS transporter [Acidobacteriaceae bacterium]
MNPNVSAAWWGTVVLFFTHGFIFGTWVSRIPAVQTALRLNNGILGLTLLSSAAGALCAIPVTGRLIDRLGSKKVTSASSVVFCFTLVLPGLAFNAPSLAAGLFVLGAIGAAMDVSMNAQGVEVEKALGRPTMSRFHAMFSSGAMAGAGAGGWVAARNIGLVPHFSASALINLIAIVVILSSLLEAHPSTVQQHRLPFNKIPRVLVALSAIGFCILLSEGAMADWTAVYLRQSLHAGPGIAAEGYAVFSAAMALFRFLGDLITARLGPRRTVRTGSLVAATGLLWALCMQVSVWALPGFAVTGAGLSVIIPLVFGGGGKVESVNPGAGIATVTGIGYVGFIVGPPTIGFASQLVTLRYALGIVVACCLAAAWFSRFMVSLDRTSARPEPATELHV